MASWRNQILEEFTPQVARLTLVADPDGLLTEEGLLQAIQERGFELIPFEDHVAFRFAYESKFRSRWDKGEHTDLVVVLCSPSSDLESLPYDLLQAGRRLNFTLGDLFPHLSYPVIDLLERSDLDALYQAQFQHNPGPLGDNATKEFALRHVFGIAPELIQQPSDLLRILLRRHYQGQRVPSVLDEHFIQVLRRNVLFEEWPLERIVPDRAVFFAFLQERWPAFLDWMAAKDPEAWGEDRASYGLELPGPLALPFDHNDVRVFIDNLFLEGLLRPVSHEKAEMLAETWAEFGIQTDPEADHLRRLRGLIEAIKTSIPGVDARHSDWFHFSYQWAELAVLSFEVSTKFPKVYANPLRKYAERSTLYFSIGYEIGSLDCTTSRRFLL